MKYLNRFCLSFLTLTLFSLSSFANNEAPMLFGFKDTYLQSDQKTTNQVIELDKIHYSLDELMQMESYQINLENDVFTIIPTLKKYYADNNLSIIGYFSNLGEDSRYYAAFTIGENGMVGDFFVPKGHFSSVIIDNKNVIQNPEYLMNNLNSDPFKFDQSEYSTFINRNSSNTKSANGATSILNIAFVISQSSGNYSSVKTSMINTLNRSQYILDLSNVNIQLNLKLIAPVKSVFDNNLNNDIFNSNYLFGLEGTNMIDLDSSLSETIPSSANHFNIHQFVLVIGSTFADGVCGTAQAPERGYGLFSTYRIGNTSNGVCPNVTLIHEIAHNLTLVHEDGACTTDIDDDGPCKYIPLDPLANSFSSYVEISGVDYPWRTVMRSSAKSAIVFTGGVNNSVELNLCNGICNIEPFEDHNSIDILNQTRLTAENNYINVSMPIPPPVILPDVYEDDDSLLDSSNLIINSGFQNHTFVHDTVDWLRLNGDSHPNFNGCSQYNYQSCYLQFNNVSNNNICIERFALEPADPRGNPPTFIDTIISNSSKTCNLSNNNIIQTRTPSIFPMTNTCLNRFSPYVNYYKITGVTQNEEYSIKLICN